jgi:uncharacterized membrane protein
MHSICFHRFWWIWYLIHHDFPLYSPILYYFHYFCLHHLEFNFNAWYYVQSQLTICYTFIIYSYSNYFSNDKYHWQEREWETYQIICFGSFPTISELIQFHILKIRVRNWNDKISIIMWCDFVYYLTSSQVILDPGMIISDMKSSIREVNDWSKLAPIFDFNLLKRSKQQIWQFTIIRGSGLWLDNYLMVQ